jgi:hypothetical protein
MSRCFFSSPVLAAIILAAGCKQSSTTVQVRLRNAGTAALENVRVNFQGQIENFGTLAPGAASSYHIVAETYSYAHVVATIAGKPGFIRPHDFVGEKLLPAGKYSWTLSSDSDAAEPYDRLKWSGSARDP